MAGLSLFSSLVSIPPKGDNELRFGWPAVQARRADGLLRISPLRTCNAQDDEAGRRRGLDTGDCSPPPRGAGLSKKLENNLMYLDMHRALRCHAKSKRSGLPCRAPAVRGAEVCRMHGAGGGARKGNKNAVKHGAMVAESIALRREVQALARMTRETMAAIGYGCRDRQESTLGRHSLAGARPARRLRAPDMFRPCCPGGCVRRGGLRQVRQDQVPLYAGSARGRFRRRR